MPIHRPPTFDSEAARLAEQRWLEEETGFARRFIIAAIWLGAALAVTYLAAHLAHPGLSGLFCFIVFGGIGRVIYLAVHRHRTFIAVKMAAGMTKEQALSELNTRFGG